jgi:hypothetical protein
MRATAVVVVGLGLCGSAALAEPAGLRSEPKSLADVKADSVNVLDTGLARSVTRTEVSKGLAVNPTLKAAAPAPEAAAEQPIDGQRAGLANRKAGPDKFSGSVTKPQQLQTAATSSLANSGLRASPAAVDLGTGKDKDAVNKLR